ncbi:MAG: ATP-binding protein [Bacteroidia bacterium]|nr:ATP-binding protein [Bacteroidia bacterium]
MMRSLAITVLVLFFLIPPWNAKANYSLSALIDSVESTQDEFRKAGFLQEVARLLLEQAPQDAEGYAKEALDLLDYKRGGYEEKSSAHMILAEIYLNSGRLSDALTHAEEAKHFFTLVRNQKPFFDVKVADALMLEGRINLLMGRYQDAQNRFNQAHTLAQDFFESRNTEYLKYLIKAKTYQGEISFVLGDRAEALKKYMKALDLLMTSSEESSGAANLLYDKLATFYLDAGDRELASEYLIKQGSSSSRLGIRRAGLEFQLNKARFLELKNANNVLQAYEKVARRAKELNFQELYVLANYHQGKYLLDIDQDSKGIRLLEEGLKVAKEMEAQWFSLQITKELSAVYEEKGRFKDALYYYHAYLEIENSLFIRMATENENQGRGVLRQYSSPSDTDRMGELEDGMAAKAKEMQAKFNLSLVLILCLVLLGGFSLLYFNTFRKNNRKLRDKNKTIESTMNQLKDTIVELEDSKLKLEETNQVQKKLMTVIAHDLRGQFGSIQHFAEIMKDDLDSLSYDYLSRFATEFYSASKKINVLFENLIQWARSQIGEINFKGDIHLLPNLVNDVINLYEEHAKEKNLAIHAKIPKDLQVYTDANMLNFILRNLITNGIKFTPNGGLLMLHAVSLEGQVKISVIDNGIGMSKEIQSKIFDIGKGSSREGTAREKGTGIGMALCAEFATQMNTKLEVNSIPDQGTTISFTLPMVSQEEISEENELLTIKSGS